MGYTHYWYQRRAFTDHEWEQVCAAFNAMRAQLPEHTDTAGGYSAEFPLKLCGWNGEGKPNVDEIHIAFNGSAADNLDCDTFFLAKDYALHAGEYEMERFAEHGPWFQFCKTQRLPYDLVVCALLLAASEIAPGWADVSSDGDMEGEEWHPARDFLKSLKVKA